MNEKRAARENLVEEVIEKLNERMKDAQVDAGNLWATKTYLFYLS